MGIMLIGGGVVTLAVFGHNMRLIGRACGVCCPGNIFDVCLLVLLVALHVFMVFVGGDTCLLGSFDVLAR